MATETPATQSTPAIASAPDDAPSAPATTAAAASDAVQDSAQSTGPAVPEDLIAAAAARDAKLRTYAPKGQQEEAQATEAQASERAAAPGQVEAEAETSATEQTKQDETTKDPVADRIATYMKQERRLARDRAQLEADRKAVAAEKAAVEAAKTLQQKSVDLRELAKRDPVAAVEALVGERMDGNLMVELLNRQAAREDGKAVAVTPEQQEAAIIEKAKAAIKAEQEAENKKRVEAEAKAAEVKRKETEAGREAFFWGLHEQLKADIDKYPYLAQKNGIPAKDADQWIHGQFEQTRKIPTYTEIFQHFNALYETEATAALRTYLRVNGGKLPPDLAPAPSQSKTPATAMAPIARAPNDTRGRATTPITTGPRSYKQDVEEMARKLDEMDSQRKNHSRY